MATIYPLAAERVRLELLSGETVYWAGMPNPSKILHSDDWTVIPFSLLWGGFWIFWESGALGLWGGNSKPAAHPIDNFMVLWGIPFVAFGQYMIWGRFLRDAWAKRRTYYAVTDRRVLIRYEGWWDLHIQTVPLDQLTEIHREGSDTGTLWLGAKLPILGSRGSRKRDMSRFGGSAGTPVLADIDDVDSVHRLILELRDKAGPTFAKPHLTYNS